ncbi:MAG: FGGY-family carbohydrate kinase, partial [Alphaproteobacteria bacterium]
SEGCYTFGDFRGRSYSEEVIAALGLHKHRHLLPPMVEGTEQTAPLTAPAAKATGLMPGTPVVLGYLDVICTALGAGLYDPAAMPGCTVIGSTGMHMRLVLNAQDVTLNEDRNGYTMLMPVPGVLAQMQSNMASTLNIDWLLGLASQILASQDLQRSPKDLIPLLDDWVAGAKPGRLLYQPHISEAGERGPFIDGNARAGFIGLSTRHNFADLVRAVFEGLAFAARDCYATMGALPREIRLTGGAARSKTLRVITAAALSANIRTSAREEAGAAGAAMMAAVAIGQYDTMDACTADWVTPLLGDLEAPDQSLADIYAETFPVYIAARQALRPVWKMMAERQVGPR